MFRLMLALVMWGGCMFYLGLGYEREQHLRTHICIDSVTLSEAPTEPIITPEPEVEYTVPILVMPDPHKMKL